LHRALDPVRPELDETSGRLLRGEALRAAPQTLEDGFDGKLVDGHAHHANVLILDGMAVAASGETGSSPLSAVDLRTGGLLWRDRALANATLVQVGSRTLALDADGNLMLAEITRAGARLLARQSLLTSRAWTPPSIADDVVHVRDRKELLALRLQTQANASHAPRE
jgi:hypothetical protein